MDLKPIVYIAAASLTVLAVASILTVNLQSNLLETSVSSTVTNPITSIKEPKPSGYSSGNNSVSDSGFAILADISGRVIAVKGFDNITILDSVHHDPVKIRLRGFNVAPEFDEEARIVLSRMIFGAEIQIRNRGADEEKEKEYVATGLLFRSHQNITLEMLRSKAVGYNADDLAYLSKESRHIYDNFAMAKELILNEEPKVDSVIPIVKPTSTVQLDKVIID
jgi:hypothetical protein